MMTGEKIMNPFHKLKNIFSRRKKETEDEFDEYDDYLEEAEFTEETVEKEPEPESEPAEIKKSVSRKDSNKTLKNKTAAAKKKLMTLGKLALTFCLLGVFFTIGHLMFGDSPAPATNGQKEAEETDLGDVKEYSLNPEILKVNPFVKIKNFVASDEQVPASTTASQGMGSMPAIPSVRAASVPSYSAGALPAIPSFNGSIPRPSLPSAAPSTSAPAAPAGGSGGAATVQGVFTGSDGNNMAIMSDGSIVGVGEKYNDNRIAYIGGDGIQFDNGTSMKYGNQ